MSKLSAFHLRNPVFRHTVKRYTDRLILDTQCIIDFVVTCIGVGDNDITTDNSDICPNIFVLKRWSWDIWPRRFPVQISFVSIR